VLAGFLFFTNGIGSYSRIEFQFVQYQSRAPPYDHVVVSASTTVLSLLLVRQAVVLDGTVLFSHNARRKRFLLGCTPRRAASSSRARVALLAKPVRQAAHQQTAAADHSYALAGTLTDFVLKSVVLMLDCREEWL
jgi:hypothetical protein